MSGPARDMGPRLLELLEQECKLLEHMLELTANQAELLADDDAEGFDKSLDGRQALIDQINGLHRESDALMQSFISRPNGAATGQEGEIEAVRGKIRGILEECAALNERNTTEAKGKAEDYIKQIGKMSINRKSIGAYIQDVPNNSELFDKKT